MKVSTNIIKALAVGDMLDHVTKFQPKRDFSEYGSEAQEKYNEHIQKLKQRILNKDTEYSKHQLLQHLR